MRSLKEALSEDLEEAAKTLGDAQVANLCLVTNQRHILLFDGAKALKDINNIQTALANPVLAELDKVQQEVMMKYRAFYVDFLQLPKQDKFQSIFLSEKLNRLFNLLTNKSKEYSLDREHLFRLYPEIASWSPREIFMYRKQVHDIEQKDPELLRALKSLGRGQKEHSINQLIKANFVGLLTISVPNRWNVCADKDVFIVSLAAAEKGWGPLMYDIALSLVYPKFLISSRDDVSQHARKIWDHYLNNRSDIEHVSMADLVKRGACDIPNLKEINDDLEDARTKFTKVKYELENSSKDDQDFASLQKQTMDAFEQYKAYIRKKEELIKSSSSVYKFRIKQPITNTQKLKQNTANFLQKLNETTGLKFHPETLAHIGEEYFWKKYGTRAQD